jgi:4-amino-4-deoxy-L-arabinose transferase
MNQKGVFAAGVVFFFLLVFVAPLGVRPLFLPDETRYAEIPREMLAAHDWVVPRMLGMRYFEKPPLGYWLTAGSIAAFGENRFAARLPSALAAGLTALIVGLLVRRTTGSQDTGSLTAFCYLTLLMVVLLGLYNLLDGPFVCLVTASMAFSFLATESHRGRKRGVLLALFGACAGLAFLTKGFLGLAIPALSLGGYLVWQRRWRDLLVLPWIPLAVAVAVALPWGIAVHLREPDYWRHFFWVEHVQRFLDPDVRAQHGEPFWFLAPYLLGGVLPWLLLIPAACPGIRARVREQPAIVRFALCWLVLPFLLVSASSGKLGTYVLPCLSPVAILIGLGLSGEFSPAVRKRLRAGCYAGAALAAAATAAIVAARWAPGPLRAFDTGENGIWLAAVAAGLIWVGLSFFAARIEGTGRLVAFALGPIAVLLTFQLATPARFLRHRAPEAFLNRHAETVHRRVDIVTTSHLAPAVAWQYKRTDITLMKSPGEFKYGLGYADAAGRYLSVEEFRSTLSHVHRKHDIAVILETREAERMLAEGDLPPPGVRSSHASHTLLLYRRL